VLRVLTIGVVRGISYGLFGPPEDFGAAARDLNARLIRAYVYWHQVEPTPGEYDWTVVDRLLAQVEGWGRLWLTVCSSSPWATRTATTFLPPSPPLDPAAYGRFIAALAERARQHVEYWQCENEPSNTGLLWAGSAEEYASLLGTFAAAVRSVPGAGHVVLGGIGYDVLSTEADSEQWEFFDIVCGTVPDAFDFADIHLYDDPRRIAAHAAAVRELLTRNACDQPLVVGELGGPTILGFPEAEHALQTAMLSALSGPDGPGTEAPDRRAMRALYDRLDELPPELQQFLDGSPPDVASRRDRIACREVVTRTLLALAEGVSLACWWDLAPEVPGYSDPYNMLGLVSARLALLDFQGDPPELVDAQPAAATFRMLAAALRGAIAVERITLGDRGDVHAFTVVFPDGSDKAVQVLWRDAGPFEGDEDAREAFEWQWVHDGLHVANAFAQAVPVPAWNHGRLAVPLTATPILLSSTPLVTVG
jgi:hypothetical protein